MTTRLLVGDVFHRMAELPDHSFDLIVTSPPFLCLRSYLPDDHPDKALEIGSEATPADYLDTLLALTAEWRRLLAPHGSLAVELGDTYAGSGGGGGDYLEGGWRENEPGFGGSAARAREGNAAHWRQKNQNKAGWPLDKSLTGIPTLYAWSLAYGRNLLTGAESPAGRWRIRNLKPWIRSNPPVGALGDKERPATSYITVACVGGSRWFDLDSARQGARRPSGAAGGAVLGVADARVLRTTLDADGRPSLRGWCKPGKSKIAVGSAVTWQAQRLQVVKPVGFLMGVEEVVGPKMVDLQATVAPAAAASVAVAVEGLFAGSVPVATSVGGAPAVPAGVVLASDVDAPPFAGTLEAAEVVGADLALVAGQWLAARVALKLNGASATAYAVTPLLGAELASWHSEESSSNHDPGGAPPLDWWHPVDAVIDQVIDQMAKQQGETVRAGGGGPKTVAKTDGMWSTLNPVTVTRAGARGVHIRRALTAAGLLPPGDFYDVSPRGYAGAHYAVWPPELVRLLIDEMCPRKVCVECGVPSRRIVGEARYIGDDGREVIPSRRGKWEWGGDFNGKSAKGGAPEAGHYRVQRDTVGWSDCGCEHCICDGHDHRGAVTRCKFCDCDLADHWRPGRILDPFSGSGTTLAVASGMGRDSVGIDLDPRSADLTLERVGMFLEVDYGTREATA